jgi:hypothetical protein
MKGKKLILVAPFEDSNISTPDHLVGMINECMSFLKMELFRRLLVTAGEKGVVRQNLEAMNQAYKIGQELK